MKKRVPDVKKQESLHGLRQTVKAQSEQGQTPEERDSRPGDVSLDTFNSPYPEDELALVSLPSC